MGNCLSLNFNRYKPKQTYTFVVEFEPYNVQDDFLTDKDRQRLSNAVSSITIPKVQIQTIQDQEMGFGLFWKTIPVHDLDSKELTIVFDETDDMLVTRKFAKSITYSNTYRDLWSSPDFRITIRYYNEYQPDTENGGSICTSETYIAIVKDFQHPQWNRTGNVDKMDVTVSFKVMLVTDWNSYHSKIQKRLNELKQQLGSKKFIETVEEARPVQVPDNEAPDASYFNWRADNWEEIAERIRVKYNEWLRKTSQINTMANVQKFLSSVLKASDVGNGGNRYVLEGNYIKAAHGMCARGTVLQLSLYTGTAYVSRGSGKDVTTNLLNSENGAAVKKYTQVVSFDDTKSWTTAQINAKLKKLMDEDPTGVYVISERYAGEGHGHSAIATGGQVASDFIHTKSNLSGTSHQYKGIEIVKVDIDNTRA